MILPGTGTELFTTIFLEKEEFICLSVGLEHIRTIRNFALKTDNIQFEAFKIKLMPLAYSLIKSEKQYFKYCDELEELLKLKKKTRDQNDLIDLLTLLIEKYDDDHDTSRDLDPVEFIVLLMKDHKMKPVDLGRELGVSKSLVSDVLNYRRAVSKVMVRKLAERFKMQQEAFNRPYWLKVSQPKKKKKKSLKPA